VRRHALRRLRRSELARDYPGISPDEARVTLVEAGPELFSMFKPNLRQYATKTLTKRTVDVQTGAMVATVSPNRVKLKSREELKAHTLVWGAGLQGSPVVQ
jgi:NADH:quinone reductase (non-electrogenic)